jgi:short-subunit dehydrogenase
MIDINLSAVIDLVERLVPLLPSDGTATIAIISSVAGDRGRQSNYVYGASKAGLTAYTDGLRNRLFHERIHVLTIKPGFVATPMTAGKIKAGSPVVATPAQAAHDILNAIAKRKNTLYTRWFWRWIMAIITAIPEPIFKRLRL